MSNSSASTSSYRGKAKTTQMDNGGRDRVVYSLVQRDGKLWHMRVHEKGFWSEVFACCEKEIGGRGTIQGYDTIVAK
uniref:Uncharacterized protein n=1 Tax=Tanacetum cinerariifolium TaxID=118510 RepID=A0A699JRD7_TANCI|nr:hypothetical protein [Tanacetum cinerariifolium]